MNIGDKVRFLNDVGGGVITGFQGKDMVLVSDENGFEIPTLIKDVVVIETDNYNIAKKVKDTEKKQKKQAAADHPAPTSIKNALRAFDEELEEEETDIADKELTYKPMAQERRGANEVNLFLAFVPVDIHNVTDTAFETYLVNDCNYYIHFALLSNDGKISNLRHSGEIAPNTKLFLEEFRRDRLAEWERITVMTMPYKVEKDFLFKPAFNIPFRIEGQKFYKLHSFQPSPFFSEKALIFDLIKNDRPAHTLYVEPTELEEAMQEQVAIRRQETPARISSAELRARRTQSERENRLIEIDLHAKQLLDTMVGLEPRDILDYQLQVFHQTMKAHLKQKGQRIIFIHGKGDGILRNALLKELSHRYKQCQVQDASFREYGYGATMVTIG